MAENFLYMIAGSFAGNTQAEVESEIAALPCNKIQLLMVAFDCPADRLVEKICS